MGKSKRGQRGMCTNHPPQLLPSTETKPSRADAVPSEFKEAMAAILPPPAMIRALRALTAKISAAVRPQPYHTNKVI